MFLITPALAIMAVQLFTGLRGIDFGDHWDESKQIQLVRYTVRTGDIRHGWYNYPSMSYWLAMTALAPHVAGAAGSGADVQEIRAHLLGNVLDSHNYLLQVRKVFLTVSILATLWVYLAGLALGLPVWGATFAAGLMGLSWEANYHARWIAPDAVLMQWSALALLCLLLYLRRGDRPALVWLAAAVAGLAAGTKYTGGILLAPVLLAFFWNNPDKTLPYKAARMAGLVLTFGLVYLAVTPGTLLEPREFLSDVRFEMEHYATGHYGRSIEPGIGHLARIGVYFGFVFFSYFELAAVLLAVAILWGAYRLWRSERREFVLLAAVPLAIALFFSTQRIMSPRNILFIAPFLALLGGLGIADLVAQMWDRRGRIGLVAASAAVLGLNAFFLFYAAESIAGRSEAALIEGFLEYAAARPETVFLVDGAIWDAAAADQPAVSGSKALPANFRATPDDDVDLVAFRYTDEDRARIDWPLGLPKPYVKVFGPFDVNLDYYPGWVGSEHILVLPVEKAVELHVLLDSE